MKMLLSILFLASTAHGAVLKDAGPLPRGAFLRYTENSDTLVHRVRTFGKAMLQIQIRGAGDPVSISVEGPFTAEQADKTPVGETAPLKTVRPPLDTQGRATVSINLSNPGVYRLLPLGRSFTLRVDCEGACNRPTLSRAELLLELRKRSKLEPLRVALRQKIEQRIPDPAQRQAVLDKLKRAEQSPQLPDRFPVVPPLGGLTQKMRPLLAGLEVEAKPQEPETPVTDWDAYLEGCDVDRKELPAPVMPSFKDVRYGHYLNEELTPCQIAQSRKVAHLFNVLSREGAQVEIDGKTFRSLPELMQSWIASGFSVETKGETTYANFLAIALDSKDSTWPLWLDTGLQLPSGQGTLAVPMGHSQVAWYIRGPKLEAHIAFFLGMAGAGFFPLVETRPAWTGNRARWRIDTSDPKAAKQIEATLEWAVKYLKLNRTEKGSLPFDGYGVLGVCNDSAAAVEMAVFGTTSAYPLVRTTAVDAMWNEVARLWNPLLEKLPQDAGPVGLLKDDAYRRDAFERILEMTPLSLASPLFPDARLAKELREIASYLKP